MDDRQKDNGTQKCDQHGRNGEGIIDCPDVEDGAEEITSQDCSQDSHNDIDQQVWAVMHELSRNPADHCCNQKLK